MLNKIKKGVSKLNVFKSANVTNFSENAMQNNAKEIHQHFADPKLLIRELISNGRLDLAVDVLKETTTVLENSHPLAPEYQYDVRKIGKKTFLTSKPANHIVAQEKPLSFRGGMTIIDERYNSDVDVRKFILQQSFRNNNIKVRLDSLEELIDGEVIDNPLSLLKVAGNDLMVTIRATHERPVIKAKMIVKEAYDIKSVIDYLELQITDYEPSEEILVISNENQKLAYLDVKIKIPLQLMKTKGEMIEIASMNYNVTLREEHCNTISGELFFLEFLKSVRGSDSFQIIDVELDSLIFEGTNIKNKATESEINNFDSQIKAFKMLKDIEGKNGVKFNLPDTLDEEEVEILNILDIAWNSKEVKNPLTEFTASVNDKQSIINIIEVVEAKENSLFSIESNQTIAAQLFGVEIECLSEETFDMLVIKNVSRLKSKLDLFEEGEIIKIPFIPNYGAMSCKKIKLLSAKQVTS